MDRVFIANFVNQKPPVAVEQDMTVSWLINRHSERASTEQQRTMEKRFRYYGVKKEKISKRYFAVRDVLKSNDDELTVYSKENCNDIGFKADFFNHYAIEVFKSFYSNRVLLPEHIIHVTCTGYVSPSAPQVIVSELGADTKVTHAYHMGCYAALPAVRAAASFVKSKESEVVDVVHTEACSLHMDPRLHTAEQIVIQTLFADGNIKYSISSKPSFECFELLCHQEKIIPNTDMDMRWELRQWGFAMTLSRTVPDSIGAALKQFIDELANAANILPEQLFRQGIFAIHPGGPKIVEAVAHKLDLTEPQIYFSQKVLYERGNMSSATLPHVWEEIINHKEIKDGQLIASLAFGPGLTIFGSIFRFRRGG